MAEHVYNPSTYDRLPNLTINMEKFNTAKGNSVVGALIRPLFLRHRMERTFGLVLLHRHFELSPKERLVTYQGTSVPWTEEAINDSKIKPGTIQPSSWLLDETGDIHPYEFEYISHRDTGAQMHIDAGMYHFLQSFQRLLREQGLLDVLGLCRYPGDGFRGDIELTMGRANIKIHPTDVSNSMHARPPFRELTFTTFFFNIYYIVPILSAYIYYGMVLLPDPLEQFVYLQLSHIPERKSHWLTSRSIVGMRGSD